jgi:hypothetical protein
MRKTVILLALVFVTAALSVAAADTIVLTNGRRLHGTISRENDEEVVVEQKSLGQITLKRSQISEIIRDKREGPDLPKPEEKKEPGEKPDAKPAPGEQPETGKKPQAPEEPQKTGPAREQNDIQPEELEVVLKPDKAWTEKNGTCLKAQLGINEGTILEWELLKAEITRFEDNVGTELGKKDKTEFYGSAGMRVQTLPEGKKFEITFDAKGAPRDTATAVSVRCMVPFWYATKKESGTVESITLAEGSTFKVGGIEMKIASIEERKNYKGKQEQQVDVTFTVEGPWVDEIFAEMKFTDPEGKDVEWRQSIITGAIPKTGPIDCRATWHFETTAKTVRLGYTLWKDVQFRCAKISASAQLKKE